MVKARCASSRGFSLIEVLIALALLAIITTALFSQMAVLRMSAELSRERTAVSGLTLALSNAFAGASFSQLRTATLPWSLGRYCPVPTLGVPPPAGALALIAGIDQATPLTDDPQALPSLCLLRYTATGAAGLGLLDSPTGLRNLKVWVEYYRGSDYDLNGDDIIQTAAAAQEVGLLDSPPAGLLPLMLPHCTYDNHLPGFNNAPLIPYRMETQPSLQVDPEGTIIIRIVMTYRIQSTATGSINPVDYMSSFVVARRR